MWGGERGKKDENLTFLGDLETLGVFLSWMVFYNFFDILLCRNVNFNISSHYY